MIRVCHGWARSASLGIIVAILAAFSTAFAQQSPEVENGLRWLGSQVKTDGTLHSTSAIATGFQAASETARTLRALSTAPASLIANIGVEADHNTEYLARKILSLPPGAPGLANYAALLAPHQNPDGGFGGTVNYSSNTLDTAFALAALQKTGTAGAASANAAAYLRAQQDSGGGFRFDKGELSPYITAVVSSSLQVLAGDLATQSAVSRANAWLLEVQHADGGWGSVAESSLVQLALMGTSSDAALQSRVSSLILSQQSADGSWGADTYITALALRALATRPAKPATAGSITGRVVDAVTGTAVAGATISTATAPVISVVSDSTGRFTLKDVPAGTHTLSLAAGGGTSTMQLTVKAGVTIDIGTQVLNTSSTATLSGVVRDTATRQPLAGALVAVQGAATSSVVSQADGSYRLSGLAPGIAQINVSKSGYAAARAQATLVSGGSLIFDADLAASSNGATLNGRIIDRSSGQPLAFVAVTGPAGATTSGADGRFALAVTGPGQQAVSLALAEYDAATFTLTGEFSGNIDIGTIAMNKSGQASSTATVRGVARDALDGTALAGVLVKVNGSASWSALTDAAGAYTINNVPTGALTLEAGRDGYVSTSASATVAAGQTVIFNPQLHSAAGPGVRGRVVDIVSAAPLGGVKAALAGTTLQSTASGQFNFAAVAQGNHSLVLSADGYTPYTIPVQIYTGYSLDLGTITLAQKTLPVTVRGSVKDAVTGKAIAGASVTILGSLFSVLTDAAGEYRIEGVPQGQGIVRYSAVGYLSETVEVTFTPYNQTPHDRTLLAGQAAGLTLSVASAQLAHVAYEQLKGNITIGNDGTQPVSASVSISIIDAKGRYLDSFNITRAGQDGNPQITLQFAPGANTLDFQWNSAAHPPGTYTAIVRVHQRNDAASDANLIELAQQRMPFEIVATEAIGSVSVTPLPAYSNIGADEQLGFRVDAVNRSNVPVTSKLRYTMMTPANMPARSGEIVLQLQPAESTKSIMLPAVPYTFASSGVYPVVIEVIDGVVPAQLGGGRVTVAPGTRIEVRETITPHQVAPDGTKKIRIDLRLQGIETK